MVAKHGCRVMARTKVVHSHSRIIVYRQRCEKHEVIQSYVAPWLAKVQELSQKRKLALNAKKPHCQMCNQPVVKDENGFHLNTTWLHYKCVQYHLKQDYGSYHNCTVCNKNTACIVINGVAMCMQHATELLPKEPWYTKLPQQAMLNWKSETDYSALELDEFGTSKDLATELGPNPYSATPNGWMPHIDESLEKLDEECGMCMMPIGKTERVTKNGVFYHEDCAKAVTLL
jgi:hypothetical protein